VFAVFAHRDQPGLFHLLEVSRGVGQAEPGQLAEFFDTAFRLRQIIHQLDALRRGKAASDERELFEKLFFDGRHGLSPMVKKACSVQFKILRAVFTILVIFFQVTQRILSKTGFGCKGFNLTFN